MHFNDSESKNESYSVLDEKNSQAGPDETRGHIVDSFINQFDFQNAFNNASKVTTIHMSITTILHKYNHTFEKLLTS